MSAKKKILILTERPLHNGPRMIREFEAFSKDFELCAIGLTPPANKLVKYVHFFTLINLSHRIINAIFRKLFLYKITSYIHEDFPWIRAFILKEKFDVVIAHESSHLPFLNRLKKKFAFKLIYNAHEYHPLEFDSNSAWLASFGRYHFKVYQDNINQVDLLINVCDGIAAKCEEEFGVKSLVIPNAAFYKEISIHHNENFPIKLIYHGAVMINRKIEEMIKVMVILGANYTLDIMAVIPETQQSYRVMLEKLALEAGNVFFKDPVGFDEIIPTINKYDIGLYLLNPKNFNDTMSLPNKLFEYIQGRLALVISPSPEMKKIVDKYQLGLVGDDFSPENLAEKIKQLTREDILKFKANAVIAAQYENAATYNAKYLKAVNDLFKVESV